MNTFDKSLRRAVIVFILVVGFAVAVRIGVGQQPAPKLNPEAVKALAAIFDEARVENDRHAAVIKALSERQVALYTGAGIPKSEWDRAIEKIEADGTIVFQPRLSPSPTTTPAKP